MKRDPGVETISFRLAIVILWIIAGAIVISSCRKQDEKMVPLQRNLEKEGELDCGTKAFIDAYTDPLNPKCPCYIFKEKD